MCYVKPQLKSMEALISKLEQHQGNVIVGVHTLRLKDGTISKMVINPHTLEVGYIPFEDQLQDLIGNIWIAV